MIIILKGHSNEKLKLKSQTSNTLMNRTISLRTNMMGTCKYVEFEYADCYDGAHIT